MARAPTPIGFDWPHPRISVSSEEVCRNTKPPPHCMIVKDNVSGSSCPRRPRRHGAHVSKDPRHHQRSLCIAQSTGRSHNSSRRAQVGAGPRANVASWLLASAHAARILASLPCIDRECTTHTATSREPSGGPPGLLFCIRSRNNPVTRLLVLHTLPC